VQWCRAPLSASVDIGRIVQNQLDASIMAELGGYVKNRKA
jgi:hypothetical protein